MARSRQGPAACGRERARRAPCPCRLPRRPLRAGVRNAPRSCAPGVRRRIASRPASATSRHVSALETEARAGAGLRHGPADDRTAERGRALEGDEPQRHHAAAHRGLGSELQRRVPVAMKEMLAQPASASASSSSGRFGARLAASSTTPKPPPRRRVSAVPCVRAPPPAGFPATAPIPIAASRSRAPPRLRVGPCVPSRAARPGTHRPGSRLQPSSSIAARRARDCARRSAVLATAPVHGASAGLGRSAARSSVSSEATTATKLAALKRKHTPVPTVAIRMPPTAGPTVRATLAIRN